MTPVPAANPLIADPAPLRVFPSDPTTHAPGRCSGLGGQHQATVPGNYSHEAQSPTHALHEDGRLCCSPQPCLKKELTCRFVLRDGRMLPVALCCSGGDLIGDGRAWKCGVGLEKVK